MRTLSPRRFLGGPGAALLASGMVIILVLGLRMLGGFESLELATFDLMMQKRTAEAPDPRILLVEITESDRNAYGEAIPDEALFQLLDRLESYQPRAIGFDIYRPKPAGNLARLLERSHRLVGVAKVNARSNGLEIPPPPALASTDSYGFADVPLDDREQTVRRYLFYGTGSRNLLSFPATLALKYLEGDGISLAGSGGSISLARTGSGQEKQLAVLSKLSPNTGGYQNRGDFSRGYSLLINYRSPVVADAISRADVMAGRLDPRRVRDKIVLVGYQGESFADYFRVPYTAASVPGLTIHAQVVSDLLSTALDGRKPFWFWSEPVEGLWVTFWGLFAGGAAWWLASSLRSPLLALLAGPVVLFLLGASVLVLFGRQGWVPFAAPTAAALVSIGLVAWTAAFPVRTVQPTASGPGALAVTEAFGRYPSNRLEARNTTEQTAVVSGPQQELAGLPVSERLPAVARQDVWLGRTIGPDGRYEIREHLGSGGMGDVFLAGDARIGRSVALKLLKPHLADTAALHLRFVREVRISAALESNHIVQVSDFGITEEGVPYYVMEYLRGQSLRQVLSAEAHLEVERTVRIAMQICEGLKLAHEGIRMKTAEGRQELVRVVHRDLKPENIFLVGTSETVKLLDFGIAKVLDADDTGPRENHLTANFLGTSRYASPEQWMSALDLDPRSDIYSLGVICYEMLSGGNPFDLPLKDTNPQPMLWYEGHKRTPPRALRSRPDCQNVPEALDEIVLRCLAKQPAQRFATVGELQQSLQRVFSNL